LFSQRESGAGVGEEIELEDAAAELFAGHRSVLENKLLMNN